MNAHFAAPNNFSGAISLIGNVMEFLKQAGLNARSCFLAELVLEELLTNTVKYAYDATSPREMRVLAEVTEGRVSLDFFDDGNAFDPTQAPDPQAGVSLLQRKPGGQGLALLRRIPVSLAYQRQEGLNHLRVTFSAHAEEAAEALSG